MVSTIPARAPLGASTTNRKWWFDVEDPAAPGIPVGVFGVGEFKFKPSDATQQDDSDFDGEGYKSSTVTALTWGGDGKLHRKTTTSDPTAYDPGQEILRKASRGMGTGNRVKIRVYEMEPDGPRVEAYSGYVLVTWSPDGGGMDALDTVSFSLVGQGKCSEIAHPEGVTAVPVLIDLSANGKGAGGTVSIVGAHFTGVIAANVTFNGVAATSIEVVNDGLINAVLPAGAAGTVPVVVGASNTLLYTRIV